MPAPNGFVSSKRRAYRFFTSRNNALSVGPLDESVQRYLQRGGCSSCALSSDALDLLVVEGRHLKSKDLCRSTMR